MPTRSVPHTRGPGHIRGFDPPRVPSSSTFRNSFEGGTDGVAITTANSGGTSGDAFTGLNIGGSITFDASTSAVGAFSGKLVNPEFNTTEFWWSTAGRVPADQYGRAYMNLAAFPTTGDTTLIIAKAAGANLWYMSVTTAGLLKIFDTSNTLQATSSTTLPTASWFRLEWHTSESNPLVVQIYTDPQSSVATETVTAAANTLGTNLDQTLFSVNRALTVNLDELGIQTTTWIGPAIPAPSGTAYTDTGTISLTVSLSGVDELDSVDTGTIPVTSAVSGADQVASIDSGTIATGTIALSGADSQGATDTGTIPLAITLSGADKVASTDSGSIPVTIALSGSDQLASTDAGAIPLTITLTGADLAIYGESGQIPLTLSATGSDQLSSADSGSIPLTVTVTGTEQFGAFTGPGFDDIVDRRSNRVLPIP